MGDAVVDGLLIAGMALFSLGLLAFVRALAVRRTVTALLVVVDGAVKQNEAQLVELRALRRATEIALARAEYLRQQAEGARLGLN